MTMLARSPIIMHVAWVLPLGGKGITWLGLGLGLGLGLRLGLGLGLGLGLRLGLKREGHD